MMRSVWVSIISNPFQCLAVAPMPFEAPHSMLPNHQVAVGDTLGNYLKTNGEGDAIWRASRPTARDRDFRTGSNRSIGDGFPRAPSPARAPSASIHGFGVYPRRKQRRR